MSEGDQEAVTVSLCCLPCDLYFAKLYPWNPNINEIGTTIPVLQRGKWVDMLHNLLKFLGLIRIKVRDGNPG